jgi:hypothetical protein
VPDRKLQRGRRGRIEKRTGESRRKRYGIGVRAGTR